MSGVYQGSCLESILFDSSISGIDYGIKYVLSTFDDDTKLSGLTVDVAERRDAIQRNFDKLKRWAFGSVMRLTKMKCEVLHLDKSNPRYVYRLGELQGHCISLSKTNISRLVRDAICLISLAITVQVFRELRLQT